jgi:hypothetical protein
MGSGVLQQEAIWRHKYLLLNRGEYTALIAAYFIMIMLLLVGCSSTTNNYENRPFFLAEEDIATHGRKSWFANITLSIRESP